MQFRSLFPLAWLCNYRQKLMRNVHTEIFIYVYMEQTRESIQYFFLYWLYCQIELHAVMRWGDLLLDRNKPMIPPSNNRGQMQSSQLGIKSRLWHWVAHGKCTGVDSGVDIRWGYSQLRHRVPYTMFFFGFGRRLASCGIQGTVSKHFLV